MAYFKPTAAAVLLAGLAGCVESESTSSTDFNRMAPASDEAACLSAVAAQANNSVMVMSSSTSEANNLVMVGVGSQQAPWRCLVNGGTVVEVMSMTNEGSL
jgi:hypothetical protein